MYIVAEAKSIYVPEKTPAYREDYVACNTFLSPSEVEDYIKSLTNEERDNVVIYTAEKVNWEWGIKWKFRDNDPEDII